MEIIDERRENTLANPSFMDGLIMKKPAHESIVSLTFLSPLVACPDDRNIVKNTGKTNQFW